MSAFYKLIIKEVKHETPHAISVAFAVPNELKPAYEFLAGQYVNLKLTLDGQEIRRAYSICSSPHTGELCITIKAVEDGLFSTFAHDHLKKDDLIEVGQPEGKFTFEPKEERQRNYIGFAAGSGITPVMSILKSVMEGEPDSTFVLVYGNKSPEETIYHDELHELQLKYTGRLLVQYVFSKVQVENELFGRIDKSVVNFILNNKHKEISFDKFYMCGPEGMINTVSGVLKEHNIADKKIKFELFSVAPTEDKVISSTNGHTQITVLVDDEETTFEMNRKQTLLAAALMQGIDAPYSCQGGICSSCLARISKGTAEMKKNTILSDDEIAEGLILTCQAHPTSAEIVVDYDDV